MSYFDNFLKTNQAYADLHGTEHLPQKPKTQVAIARGSSTWFGAW